MKSFAYHAPTALYFGQNCLQSQIDLIKSFGKKAFIITSVFSGGARNLALEDIQGLFAEHGVDSIVYSDTEENPSVESVVKAASALRTYDPDMIFCIGGGSALDTAKAVNVLIRYPADCDAYQVFYGNGWSLNKRSCGLLPLLGVPTTAGSGSEVMGYAVLTRNDTHTKLRMDQMSFFDAAFLDAKYIADSPQWLLDAGAMDALAHGVEGYLNTFSCAPERLWHDYGFRLFKRYKDALRSCTLEADNFERMLTAASVQGIAVMQSGTSIPHGMGYPLTHFKNVTHGLASAIMLPAYLEVFQNRELVDHVISACGFENVDEFSAFIDEICSRNISIAVTDEEIEHWADQCYALTTRLERHPEPITRDQIRDMYRKALRRYIKKEQQKIA
ncbi:MAG: iron-containing alcohol dehydrogenase [Oscillospiraceae bacterium]|nr:iron-containing alcohol dehydrogenase [Oscillospiraceae bacterium]MBP5744638.1 iron-containing alcohol dehydrogenase [Oscillospiraceae bacterium]